MERNSYFTPTVTHWMKEGGEDADVVLSTRIRLARNLRGIPFPHLLTSEQVSQLENQVIKALQKQAISYTHFSMRTLQQMERLILMEKHLISPKLVKKATGSVLLNENETTSIMVNEEDHLRIQCLYPGLQIQAAYRQANAIDDVLEQGLPYAFDEMFGYLTTCPSNTGTGLRASVMLHLPTLTFTKKMPQVVASLKRFGMVVRGSYGEGSEALGSIYQLSNQWTVGKTEQQILDDLDKVTQQVIASERQMRQSLLEHSEVKLHNRIFRSYGILMHARLLSAKEAAKRLSDIRLGIDLGLITTVNCSVLNELMVFMRPAFLEQYAGNPLSEIEGDVFRAQLVRERLMNQVIDEKNTKE